jgi:hypothetical protein
MKRFSAISSVILLAFLASGCVSRAFTDPDDDGSGPVARRTVEPGTEFEVAFGETVAVDGTGLEITFSYVSGDSRCGSDVICFWQGVADILLSVNGKEIRGFQVEASIPGLITTPFYENTAIDIDGYTLRLLQLDPYPMSTHRIEEKEYRALLVLDV